MSFFLLRFVSGNASVSEGNNVLLLQSYATCTVYSVTVIGCGGDVSKVEWWRYHST